MPYVISGEISPLERLIHFTPESFHKNRGVKVKTRIEAVDIFPEEQVVEVKDLTTGKKEKMSYKKLLIATGASPKKLPFIDYSFEGVFNFHNIPDLKDVLDFFERHKPDKAAVIGAGNIGLELTEVLKQRGIDVFLFEIFPEPAFLWPPLIREESNKKIKEKGIHFYPGTAVQNVEKREGKFILKTEREKFLVDVVFSVVGTSPATKFCKGKIELSENGAIVIDRTGKTSQENIYAAGDCATVFHKVLDKQVYFPLGSTANKVGRIAGLNMAGKKIYFPGIVGTQIFKFFELSLAKTGLSIKEAEDQGRTFREYSAMRKDKAGYYPHASPVKVKIMVDDQTEEMIGASVVSEGNAAQFIDAAAVAVFNNMKVQDLGWFDSAYAPPYAPVWNALVSAALKAVKT
jgi:NADPH-dependent 2,4-dienoyl-CoA reductase/sulfur reductase-like enzyme